MCLPPTRAFVEDVVGQLADAKVMSTSIGLFDAVIDELAIKEK